MTDVINVVSNEDVIDVNNTGLEDAEFSPFFGSDETNIRVKARHGIAFKQYQGGDIKLNTSSFKYIILTVLVIFIVYLLYRIYRNLRYDGEDYNQRQMHHYFDNLHGETFDEDAKQAIAFGEAIEEPRAIDHYRLGTVYLVNANNPKQAHIHFDRALRQIIEGLVDTREAPYILDRIDDFKDHFFDFPDIEELPLQHAMLAYYEQQTNQLKEVVKEKKEIANDDPEFTQKMLLSRQSWNSDSQNVHDAAIYETLKDQFIKIRTENTKIPNVQLHGYDEAVQWLKLRYHNEPDKKKSVDKVIHVLNNNYPVGSIANTKEKDILTTVWQRTYDAANAASANDMREALADAVLDCVEGGHVVCMSGRTSKIWQALAKLDKDEKVGILKSKQLIRNEIFERAAKVVDDYVGITGSASDILKKSYNDGDNSEQVKELTETIKGQIDKISDDYIKLLPIDQLNMTITECKAAV